MDTFGGPLTISCLHGTLRPCLQGVNSLTTWLYCFLPYVAIYTQDPPTRDQLTCARLLMEEAQMQGHSGWLDYDCAFCQQVEIDATLLWNTIHAGLQAAMLGHHPKQGLFCTICKILDHICENSALALLHLPSPTAGLQLVTSALIHGAQQSGHTLPLPRCRPESIWRTCMSWNKGQCIYAGTCNYQHMCHLSPTVQGKGLCRLQRVRSTRPCG